MKQTKKIVALLLALSLMLGLPFAASAATTADGRYYVPITADGTPADGITIDGSISEAEWGEPMAHYTPDDMRQHYQKGTPLTDEGVKWWYGWDYQNNVDGRKENHSLDVYVRRNSDAVYIGIRMNGAVLDSSFTANTDANTNRTTLSSSHAHASITLSDFNDKTLCDYFTYNNQVHEEFVHYTMGLSKGTDKVIAPMGKGSSDKLSIADNDYAVTYDAENSAYIYELCVRYNTTGGYVSANKDLVLSLEVADAPNAEGQLNRFVVSYAAYRYGVTAKSSTANMQYFPQTAPLRVTFSEDRYVKNTFNAVTTAPTMDGVVSEAEWGNPTIITSPEHAKATWDQGYWQSESAYYDTDQRVKVWYANDRDYLYVALTVDNESRAEGDAWTHESNDKKGFYPQMTVMLAQAGTEHDLVWGPYQGVMYEIFCTWNIKFDTNGTPYITPVGQCFAKPAPTDADWAAKYDADADTMTYELRVPYSQTNIQPTSNMNVVSDIYLSTNNHGTGNNLNNNRYNIGGPGISKYPTPADGKYPFEGRCLKMTISDVRTVTEKFIDDLAAADENTVITLTESIDLGNTALTVGNGATLDLNGKSLTVKNVYALNGQIVDNTNGKGRLVIPKAGTDESSTIQLAANNTYMPLYDVNAYCFFDINSTQLKAELDESVMLGYQLKSTGTAQYLMRKDFNADVRLMVELTVSLDGGEEIQIPYYFQRDTLVDYLLQVNAQPDVNWAIVLEVFGFDQIDASEIVMTATPKLVNDTGVAMTFDTDATMTYTYTK